MKQEYSIKHMLHREPNWNRSQPEAKQGKESQVIASKTKITKTNRDVDKNKNIEKKREDTLH